MMKKTIYPYYLLVFFIVLLISGCARKEMIDWKSSCDPGTFSVTAKGLIGSVFL